MLHIITLTIVPAQCFLGLTSIFCKLWGFLPSVFPLTTSWKLTAWPRRMSSSPISISYKWKPCKWKNKEPHKLKKIKWALPDLALTVVIELDTGPGRHVWVRVAADFCQQRPPGCTKCQSIKVVQSCLSPFISWEEIAQTVHDVQEKNP